MPETVLLTATVNTTARPQVSAMTIHVNANSSTAHELLITVDGDDAALAALEARERLLRCEVEIDLGGGWEPLEPHEVRVLSFDEDLEQWSDQCALELFGSRFNPLLTGALRGPVPVRVTLVFGDLSQPVERVRFTGYITAIPYNRTTRTATVTALDEASVHAEKRVAPYIEPADEETREGYLVALLEANAVPITSLDLGPSGETAIVKPVSQFDVRLFDFVRDWISPAGAWLRFRDGGVHVIRYTSDHPAARILTPADVIAIDGVTPPPASTPTKVTAVTVNYDRVDAAGFRTLEFTETTTADYARAGAVLRQDSAGTLAAVSYGDAVATNRTVRVVRTRQMLFGDLLVYSNSIEFGWYAARVARLALDTDNTVDPANINYCYQYEDGSWRAWPVERWVPVRQTRLNKTIASNAVTRQVETRHYYAFTERALWELTGGPPPTETHDGGGSKIPLTDDGRGVRLAVESGPWVGESFDSSAQLALNERITTDYVVDADGFLTSETETVEALSRGAIATSARAGGFVYRLNSKEYWTEDEEALRAVSVRRVVYTPIDEESYLLSESTTETATNRVTTEPLRRMNGSRPRPEQVTAESRSQELRQSATDEVREALNGTIEDWVQNEYCQNANDLLTLANHRLREESAWPFLISMPADHSLRVGHYVELDGWDEDGLDGLRLFVVGVSLDVVACTMQLRCRYYPPEVA